MRLFLILYMTCNVDGELLDHMINKYLKCAPAPTLRHVIEG